MKATAKRLAKLALARGLVRTGGWNAVLTTWARRDTTVILTYHRVLEKWEPALDYSQPGMVVTVPTFERHLAFLQRHFEIVPLGTLLDARAGRHRRPRCVITFDDGWRDNYDLAFPILRRHEVPATIFLTTDFIGTDKVFWHTELIHLLLYGELSQFLGDERALAAYPRTVGEGLRRCVGSARASCADDLDTLIETVKAVCDEMVIQGLIERMARAANLRRPLLPERRFFLDWDQVRDMAANGIEIGSHGCSHRIMPRMPVGEAASELVRSKAELERRLGREALHFAFPNEDANETLIGLAAKNGYRTACVGRAAGVAAGSRIHLLRRVGMHEGVGVGGSAHDDALLSLCLLRAPKSWPS